MAWQGARLRPSRYSASGGSRRPQRKIEHRSLPPASIAASDSVRTERKGERRPLAPRRSGMSPNASHRVRPGLSSAASLITTLLISYDQEVLNQHLNLVTPEYPFFESPCGNARTGKDVRADFAHGCVLGGRCLGPSAPEKPLHEAPRRLHGLFRSLIGNHAHGPGLLLDHAQQPIPVVLTVLRQPIPVGFEVGNPPLFLGYKGFQPLKSFLKNMGITVCSRRSFSRFAFVRCLGLRTSLRTGL